MQGMQWDRGLKVTGEGEGLVGHAGAVLLRKLVARQADRARWDRRWHGRGSSRWSTAVWHSCRWRWRSRWGPPA